MNRKALFAAAVLAIAPASLCAQTTVASESAARYERAEILAEQAMIMANQNANYVVAASYLRDAAALWGSESASVNALLNAGRFNYYANRKLVAVSALKSAGDLAEKMGDAATASRAFRDAAWVAAEAGEIRTAVELLERGERLMSSVAVAALEQASSDR